VVIAEARRLARRWYLWVLVPVVALLAWRLLPVNAQFAERFLNNDPQSEDQLLDNYRIDLLSVYTSGLGVAQWLAFLAGCLVMVHGSKPTSEVGLARRVLATAPVMVGYGLLLAVVDLAVVLPEARDALAVAGLPRSGVPGWSVPAAVIAGAVAVPAWALGGIGVGMIVASWRRLAMLVVGYPLVALAGYEIGTHFAAAGKAVGFVLLVPAAPVIVWAVLTYLMVSSGTGALIDLAVSACLGVVVLLVGYDAARRRMVRTAPSTVQAATGVEPAGQV
jgi:hypothetical protein